MPLKKKSEWGKIKFLFLFQICQKLFYNKRYFFYGSFAYIFLQPI